MCDTINITNNNNENENNNNQNICKTENQIKLKQKIKSDEKKRCKRCANKVQKNALSKFNIEGKFVKICNNCRKSIGKLEKIRLSGSINRIINKTNKPVNPLIREEYIEKFKSQIKEQTTKENEKI